MKSDLSLVGSAAMLTLFVSASASYAATFSELDGNGDGVLTEQEFVEELGEHHGPIAYRQYNTNDEPVTVMVEEQVELTVDKNAETEGYTLTNPETGDARSATDEEIKLIETEKTLVVMMEKEVQIEGVTEDEVRRSQRGFERSNAGKARSYSNKQMAAENKANAGSKSRGSSGDSSNGRSGESKGGNGGRGKNK